MRKSYLFLMNIFDRTDANELPDVTLRVRPSGSPGALLGVSPRPLRVRQLLYLGSPQDRTGLTCRGQRPLTPTIYRYREGMRKSFLKYTGWQPPDRRMDSPETERRSPPAQP